MRESCLECNAGRRPINVIAFASEMEFAHDQISPKTWRLGFVAVLALTGALFFLRLGERALWSEEVRWAEIPREMISSGNFLWPTINGHSYYDKPLGSYWLVLAAAWCLG